MAENVIYSALKFLTNVVISRILRNFEPIKNHLICPVNLLSMKMTLQMRIRKQKKFGISKPVTLMMSVLHGGSSKFYVRMNQLQLIL